MAGTNFKVKNGLEISAGTVVVSNGAGTNGQVLSSTGTGVQWVNASSGTGDVTGPASSTDNAVVRFDGTTGKIIQNSTAATISDTGNADFLSTKSDYFDIDTTATTTAYAAGRILWNAANKTASLCFDSDSVQTDLGQSIYAYVTNADSTTINLGDAVYIFGATGNRASVKKASSSAESTSSKTLGLAAMSIAANATGMIITQGTLGGLSLGSYTAGDTVYLGTTAGSITNVKPSAPTNLVVIGVVERANNGNGQILVKVQNGFELNELHDVSINGSLVSGNTLIYDATASLWKNASLTAGTGISVTNGAGSITVANTGVTSVTGTSPVSSSGGATPAISLASGYGDTQNPYGSKTANYFLAAPNGLAGVPTFRAIVAADIPTLNQNTTGSAGSVANALTISSPLTGTSYNGSAAVSIGIPVASATANGYLSSTDWTTFNNKGSGSVTSVSVVTANGVSGTVATATTTPAITLTLGAITPTSVASTGAVSGTTGSFTTSVTTPSLTNAGTLALSATGANVITASTNGSERMRISSNGFVGIGTTASSSAFTLYGNETGNAGTTFLHLNSGNNNTSYPFLASVNGTTISSSTYGWLFSNSSSNGNLEIYRKYNSTTADLVLVADRSNGNVGIGTSSPASKLNVSGSNVTVSAGYGIAYSADQNRIMTPEDNVSGALISWGSGGICRFREGSSTERMRIDSSGNVGIGTSSPSSALYVKRTSGNSGIYTDYNGTNIGRIEAASNGNLYIGITTGSGDIAIGNSSNANALYLNSSGNLGIGTSSPLQQLHLSSASATGMQITYQGVGASRIGVASGNALTFGLDTSNGATERMRIDSSGNVGIGTSSPRNKLDVVGDVVMGRSGGSLWYFQSPSSDMRIVGDTSGAHLCLIPNSANVGIGTTSPSEKLNVSGKIKASDVLLGNNGTKGYGAITTTTSTSTPTGGSSGDHYYIY